MNIENRAPSWEDLRVGTKLSFSFLGHGGNYIDFHAWRNPDVVGTVLTNVDLRFPSAIIYLDSDGVADASDVQYGYYAQELIKKSGGDKFLKEEDYVKRRFFWLYDISCTRFHKEASGTHYGIVTCSCGFANENVDVKSIVNGKYVCYNCRVVFVK